MDDLIPEFVAECREGLARLDNEVVAFERDPGKREHLVEIFRVAHTIKGTAGFLGLARLERLAHAAETLLGAWRDGACAPTTDGVSLVLGAVDRIKAIVDALESGGAEPENEDDDLIGALLAAAEARDGEPSDGAAADPAGSEGGAPAAVEADTGARAAAAAPTEASGAVAEGGRSPADDADAEAADAVPSRGSQEPAAPAGPSTGSGRVAAATTPAPQAEKGSAVRASRSGSLRVSVALLEALMAHVSDLVLTRNRLVRLGREIAHPGLEGALQRLDEITTELRDGVMKARMQPISNAWSGVPRIVRDLGTTLGKKVDLVMEGGDTELDRQLLERLRDPLTHIVRNAIDHGLEAPEERRRAGKPEVGRLRLSAAHEGGMIVVRIADDGRGLDLERIGRKAVAAGLCAAADLEGMSPRRIASFIFAPGLSTAEQVTNVSGRGVGMDVVRANVEEMGGSVEIETWPGRGTVFTITIPLTLAIVPALIVGIGEHRFALPQQGILEIVRCGRDADRRLEIVNGTRILNLRGELLPVRSLARILGLRPADAEAEDERGFVLVLEPAGHRFGLVVDTVHDSEEIVVEPIAQVLKNIGLLAGTTLLGDGSIALVFDLKALASGIADEDGMVLDRGPAETAPKDEEVTRLLRFTAGRYRRAAVPVALVQRIERVEPGKIELVGARSVIRYDNELVPVVDIDGAFVADLDRARPALLFSDAGRRFGLVVDSILDVVEENVELTVEVDEPTMLGAGLVAGESCVLLDVGYFVTAVFGDWFGAGNRVLQNRRARVLFVDDSRFFRGLLTPILESRGFEVVALDNARRALELLDRERFDIVVSDLEMPEMDGFAFAEACRARGLKLPIVALSSCCTPEARRRSRAVGFDDHVAKLDRGHLFDTIDRLAGGAGLATSSCGESVP